MSNTLNMTLKYTAKLKGFPEGSGYISLYIPSQYRHFQLQFQYCPSWVSYIKIVGSPYCSSSWGYIFHSILNRKFCCFSYIISMVHQNSPTVALPDIRQTSQPDQSCSGKSGDQANKGNL